VDGARCSARGARGQAAGDHQDFFINILAGGKLPNIHIQAFMCFFLKKKIEGRRAVLK